MHILICGAGMMAQAIAYDLIHHAKTHSVTIIDIDNNLLRQAQSFLKSNTIYGHEADVQNIDQIRPYFEIADIVISAIPYKFNFTLAELAINTHSHFIDLGGNNDIVAKEKTLHEKAKKAGVTVIPDNGLAPGLVSVITRKIVDIFDTVDSINIRVGGLPQKPQPPLNYQRVFSIDGLINEYAEPAIILDNGSVITKPSLTELEKIHFPPPFGEMEAFLTSGGCSTLPYTYKKMIEYLDYKTIRYPGHCAVIRPLFEMGLASTTPMSVKKTLIIPRDFLKELLKKNIPSDGQDVVLLQIQGSGKIKNRQRTFIYQIIDYYDKDSNLLAMQRMTGFPVAITAEMILNGQIIQNGVFCPEEIIPQEDMFIELNKRGITLKTVS